MAYITPESPRWLAAKDRHEEAARVLARLNGTETSDEEVQRQFEDIRTVVALERAGEETPFSELWKAPGRNLYRLVIACGAQYMGQIGGCNVFAYYVVIIFEQLGLGSTLARILAACTGIGWLFSNAFSQYVSSDICTTSSKRLLIYLFIGAGRRKVRASSLVFQWFYRPGPLLPDCCNRACCWTNRTLGWLHSSRPSLPILHHLCIGVAGSAISLSG